MSEASHIPVLCEAVCEAMAARDDAVYVDGTFGAGGYTRALLQTANCTVIGIDRDPQAERFAAPIKAEYGARFLFLSGCFGDMRTLLAEAGYKQVDGVMLDLGVSSMQLDQGERGFSFQHNGDLDMRMGQDGLSAADIVNTYSEATLAQIFKIYGEERRARAIARAIAKARTDAYIATTKDLSKIIQSVLGAPRFGHIHPATRCFQALRIFVNDELGELLRGLQAAEALLVTQGKLAIVSFHSLEDRIVKQFFAVRAGLQGSSSRHLPPRETVSASFSVSNRRGITADAAEVDANPRARSARLRVGERLAGDVFSGTEITLPYLNIKEQNHVATH